MKYLGNGIIQMMSKPDAENVNEGNGIISSIFHLLKVDHTLELCHESYRQRYEGGMQ